jgi:hypothetical protein
MDKGDGTTHAAGMSQSFIQGEYQFFQASFTNQHANLNPDPNNRNSQPQSSSYSWLGVMDFLRDQERKAQEREQKLIIDKKCLEERVKALEEELSKQLHTNQDLVKKMRVMEYAMLKQNKIMRGSGNH